MTSLKLPHKQHRRTHSNTVSGVSPPIIDTSPYTESTSRRNSDGSTHLVPAPPINIFAPSPISPSPSTADSSMTQKDDHNQENRIPSRSASPVPSLGGSGSEAHSSNNNTFGTHHHSVSRLFSRKPRSRRSSLSQQSTTESIESGSKPRNEPPRSSDEAFASTHHFGGVAAAPNVELANTKRNHDFHTLFRSVPEDDHLIEDFGCALQKEILLQGRVYISEQHICFNANIFGWITNLVVAFSDIIEIEKKTTALFIPNAIQISTDQSKHFLASFLSRDQAFDLIVDVWNQTKQSCEGKGSECEDDDDSDLGDESDESSDSESYTDSEGDDTAPPLPPARNNLKLKDADRQSSLPVLPLKEQASNKGTDSEIAARRRAISEVGSQPNYSPLVTQEKGTDMSVEAQPTTDNSTTSTVQQTREKTECDCLKNGEHFNKVVFDQTFPCSIEALYTLLYQSSFAKKFLLDQKNTELVIGDWQKGEGDALLVRDLSYIKPLNGSIGPKSTKCLLSEEILHLDLSDNVTQLTTTRTPDVPSGGSFCIKTRTCLMWAGFGQVRMLVTVLVDFQKSSWLKGPIESASISGQESYYNDLDVAIREKLSKGIEGTKATADPKKRKRKRKGKHHKEKGEVAAKEQSAKEPQSAGAKAMELVSDGIGWMVSNASMPSSTQISVLCMLLLVIINLFIANKMAQVDQQLGVLKEHRADSFGAAVVPSGHVQDELWDWLSKIDPEHNSRSKTDGDDSDVWAERIQASRLAKQKLDRHMEDLEQMIQRAGSNMDQVTKMVDQQRQRILNNWTN